MKLELFTYVFDTEGGTDYTEEFTVMAEDRESADKFIQEMRDKDIIPSDKRYTVLLVVMESGPMSIPSFWSKG